MTGQRNSIVIIALLLLWGALLPSCSLLHEKNDEKPVARVFDRYLYLSDLADAIPEGSSSADSAIIARGYIDKWVKNQLMLNKAEEALTDEQKDVNKKIEEYRSSLLIYSYRQKLLQQKMDTLVSEKELTEYYDSTLNNYILPEPVVKAIYVKVPLGAPEINNVKMWIRSGSIDDLDLLEKYSMNYAEKFDIFNNSWIYFSKLMDLVPITISQPDRYLRYNRNIETSDSLYQYFVHISEYKVEGEVSPLDLIRDDLKSILLNKRKIEFYNSLEKQVYNEGVTRNQFEIY